MIEDRRRTCLLLSCNPEKAAKDQAEMNEYLTSLHDDLMNNTKKEYRMRSYDRYFEVTETPKRDRRVMPKEDIMLETARNYGYFASLSNEVKDLFGALSLYRRKNIVEKGFGNLKECLDFRGVQVSSELSLKGKPFVKSVALVYLSHIKKKMRDSGLFDKWTLKSLLDELNMIELFGAPGQ